MRATYIALLLISLLLNGLFYWRHEQLLQELERYTGAVQTQQPTLSLAPQNPAENSVEEFIRQLDNGLYLQAVALLVERELSAKNDFYALQIRVRTFIEKQLENGQLNAAKELLEAMLASYPDEMDILVLNISLHELQGDFFQAIALAYDSQYRTFNSNLKAVRVAAARALFRRAAKQFEIQRDWSQIAQLSALALSLDSQFAIAQYQLARAQLEQQAFIAANSSASALLDSVELRDAAQRLIGEIERRQQTASDIPLTPHGDQYIVAVRISNAAEISMLVDTGASICTLSRSVFEVIQAQVDASYLREIQLNTAGGVVTVQLYRLSSLSLGSDRVTDLEIAINPHSNTKFDGLLGMNFLRHFEFAIDQSSNRLRLRPKLAPS